MENQENSKKSVLKGSTEKFSLRFTLIVLSIAFIVSIIMIWYGVKEPVVNIHDNIIQIKAMYGLDIFSSDISGIFLIEKSMKDIEIGRRTNGYGGIGETLKGHFNSDELGDYMLFVKSETSPTIQIERIAKDDIYINFKDSEKTKTLYEELIAVIPVD